MKVIIRLFAANKAELARTYIENCVYVTASSRRKPNLHKLGMEIFFHKMLASRYIIHSGPFEYASIFPHLKMLLTILRGRVGHKYVYAEGTRNSLENHQNFARAQRPSGETSAEKWGSSIFFLFRPLSNEYT